MVEEEGSSEEAMVRFLGEELMHSESHLSPRLLSLAMLGLLGEQITQKKATRSLGGQFLQEMPRLVTSTPGFLPNSFGSG